VTAANGLLRHVVGLFEDREHNLWYAQNGGASTLRRDYQAVPAYTASPHAGEPPPFPRPSAFTVLPTADATWVVPAAA